MIDSSHTNGNFELIETVRFSVYSLVKRYTYLSDRLKIFTKEGQIDFNSPQVLSAIQTDIEKSRINRERILHSDDISLIQSILNSDNFKEIKNELNFDYDVNRYKLRETFLSALNLDTRFDLNDLHLIGIKSNFKTESFGKQHLENKFNLLGNLTLQSNIKDFHSEYDKFITEIILPHLSKTLVSEVKFYCQNFPCIRVVQPSEFSIGPHSDISYGFSQANINFYLPLTNLYGTNSLVIESSPGKEDWHIIKGDYGMVKRFYGALCIHFTPENTTSHTRVSLDFRAVPGSCWNVDHDQFTRKSGYYNCYYKENSSWIRQEKVLNMPDYRVGFPFTNKKV